jgi:hypothetical protein
MAHEVAQGSKPMTLPMLVFGIVEVRRITRELESLDEFLRGMAIRRQTKFEMPRVSRMLEALASENGCDLLKGAHRKLLMDFLKQVQSNAPAVHMSFAADRSSSFTAKIVGWLRANIHPLTLLQIGLQPTIAAGCVIRTTNHVLDLSLRGRFAEQQQLLIDAINASGASLATTVAQPTGPTSAVAASPQAPPIASQNQQTGPAA